MLGSAQNFPRLCQQHMVFLDKKFPIPDLKTQFEISECHVASFQTLSK
jgi:hypothetical protein